MNLLRSIVINA